MKIISLKGLILGGILGGLLVSCTPHENPAPVSARIAGARLLSIDSGGAPGVRSTIPVLAVHLIVHNPGPEVRLLGYRYLSSQGTASEALMDENLVERSRSKLGRLVRLGLPTVFPANGISSGWVFFRTSDTKGRIHLSLRDVYGSFSSLDVPVSPVLPKPIPGKKHAPDSPG